MSSRKVGRLLVPHPIFSSNLRFQLDLSTRSNPKSMLLINLFAPKLVKTTNWHLLGKSTQLPMCPPLLPIVLIPLLFFSLI